MAVQLQTARLLLRPLRESDAEAYAQIHGDALVKKYLHGTDDPAGARASLAQVIADFEDADCGILAITDRLTGGLVGYGGYQPCDVYQVEGDLQILVAIHPLHRRLHYADEALAAFLRWAFVDLGRARVLGVVHPDNRASLELLRTLGARHIDDRTVLSREEIWSFERETGL